MKTIQAYNNLVSIIYKNYIKEERFKSIAECENYFWNRFKWAVIRNSCNYLWNHEKVQNDKTKRKILDIIGRKYFVISNYNIYYNDDEESIANDIAKLPVFKKIIKEINRTIEFIFDIIQKSDTTYITSDCMEYLAKTNSDYVVYEILLVLIEYFIKVKNKSVNDAMRIALRKLNMFCHVSLETIFNSDTLPYEKFYSVFIKGNIKKLSFKKDLLLNLREIYNEITK